MFKIYDGREHFYQWDLDRKLIVGDRTIQAVHFCNRTSDCALARDCYELEGNWVVDVPNICLQEDYRLKVYGYSEAKYTVLSDCFEIEARTKPEEYAYTEDEINCWQELDERLTRFEENIEEAIAEEVEAYLAAHPVEKGATDAEKEQIARNAEDIAALKAQADTYATEEYVDAAVANAGGGESEIEFVNATGDEIIEFDKTFDEIMEMIRAGKIVVIKYYGQLYYHCGGHTFRYVGSAETRYITLKDADNTFYGETILPTMEEVEDTVNAAIANIEVGGGECIVNVINSTGEDTVELDKTYDEVKAMVEAGKIVVILHANNLYYLTDKNTLTFRHLGSSSVDYIRLRDANRIQYSSISLATEDSLADFQTAEQVEAIVANYVGVIENGTY